MKKKRFPILLLALLLTVPVFAVFNGSNLGSTLATLRHELWDEHQQMSKTKARLAENYEAQHQKMVDIMEKCNELSLMLYSQRQDFTFDLCFALEKVTREYNEFNKADFNKDRMPFDQIVDNLNIEIDRYARLIEVLRRIPPEYRDNTYDLYPPLNDSLLDHSRDSLLFNNIAPPITLDSIGEQDRDTCIYYARELLKMYIDSRDIIVADSTHYRETYSHLKDSYDYAHNYYKLLQKSIFIDGQTPWPTILAQFGRYWGQAVEDLKDKYDFDYITRVSNGEKVITIENYNDTKFVYCLQAVIVILLIIEILVLWLLTTLLLLPVFHFVKPIKRRVSKEQRRFITLLIAIPIAVLINGKTDVSLIIGKAFELYNTFLWLLAAIIAALLIRLKPKQLKPSFRLYVPSILLALIVIGFRILFMPNTVMNILFPPILIVFFVWQLITCLRCGKEADNSDKYISWASLVITGATLVLSMFGFIFVALLVLVWWYFQLAAIHTMNTIWHLTVNYKEKRMQNRIQLLNDHINYTNDVDKKSLMFGVTWFYDLIKEVWLPILGLMSIPLCLHLSLDVFDFDDLFEHIFYRPFIHLTDKDGAESFQVSFRAILILISLFFIFRYFAKACRVVWQYIRYKTFLRKNNRTTIRANEINLTLGNTVISALVWMIYAIIFIVKLKIPTGSLGLVAGGLSAGVGLALKDIINNFIYGIQLLSRRLRVGDWIECDGIRGKVTDISYQTTQVETTNGTTVSFLNSELFAKNFTNLTKSNSYEFLKITVGVAYGTNIQRVREILEEAMQIMRTKDAFGRDVVEPTRGIYVVFGEFSNSSIDVAVKQYVLVAERIAYIDRAKEVIYNALNENGISIPFPQCDVHLVKDDES